MGAIAERKELSSEQITDARKLCEVINSVPEGKRPIFEIAMLAFMNGMEAGIAYAQDTTKTVTPAR